MTTKKKQEISTKELKRKYNNWMKNFVYGMSYGDFWCMRSEEAAHPLL